MNIANTFPMVAQPNHNNGTRGRLFTPLGSCAATCFCSSAACSGSAPCRLDCPSMRSCFPFTKLCGRYFLLLLSTPILTVEWILFFLSEDSAWGRTVKTHPAVPVRVNHGGPMTTPGVGFLVLLFFCPFRAGKLPLATPTTVAS